MMRNKAHLLNLFLAAIIVVLSYQLTVQPPRESKIPEYISKAISEVDTLVNIKKSVGVKGYIYPKPTLVIGSYGSDGSPNIMTVAWAGIASSEPLSIAISIRPTRKSYENIMVTKAFTVNVPSAKYVSHMDYAGNISGHKLDKFAKLGLHAIKGEFVNAPYVREFPVNIECRVSKVIDLGAHIQFIGEVVDTKVDANILDEKDHIILEKLNPIIYGGDFYYGLGKRLAKPWDIYKLFDDDKKPLFIPDDNE